MFDKNDDTCSLLNNDQNAQASVATTAESSDVAGSIKNQVL